MWHYICKEEVSFGCAHYKDGEYLCYHVDVFNKILNDNDWVFANDASDEQDWIVDQLDKMLESKDGNFVYIPSVKVAFAIDAYFLEKEMGTEENIIKEMDWPV